MTEIEVNNINDTGNFIASLYQNSLTTKPEDFLPWVFSRLKKNVKFDKVFFITLNDSKGFLTNFLYFGNNFKTTNSSKFIKITKKNPNSNTYQQLLLFSNKGFSKQDKLIIHLIFPSIVVSFYICVKCFSPLSHQAEYALVDEQANIYNASKNFTKRIKKFSDVPYLDFLAQILRGGGNILMNDKIITIKPYLNVFMVGLRSATKIDRLTPRQKQVVELLKQGYSYKKIAKQLDISPSTVTNHVNTIYPKLNIRRSSEL